MNLCFTLKRKDGKPVGNIYADTIELTLKDGSEVRIEWERSEYVNRPKDENVTGTVRDICCRDASVIIEATEEEFYLDSARAKELGFPRKLQGATPTYMCGWDNETDDSYDLFEEYQIENNEIVIGDDSYSVFLVGDTIK